jgi:hypothetical protein
MHRSLRGLIMLMLIVGFSASPWAAEGAPVCQGGLAAPLGTAFAGLHEHVGAVMGAPIECLHIDLESGDEYQQTTTGVAVYRVDSSAATFTNGHEFWRLGPDGLATWEGWHGRAGPTVVQDAERASDDQMTIASIGVYPKVEPAKVVEAFDGEHPRLVLEHDGSSVVVDVNDGCMSGQPLTTQTVFVVSNDAFAEPSSRLILEVGGRHCLITASRPR